MRLHNQYEVLEKAGEGAFGAVYKARDVHLGQIVAIKELFLDAPLLLRGEAQVLSELRHDNIVGFRQLFPEGEHWYMVMDYVNGGSLAKWIQTGNIYGYDRFLTYASYDHCRSLERIRAVATQLAEGLNYAHSKGVIHQDVKPGNVMITASGIARVSDFGLARGCPAAQHALSSDDRGRSILVSVGGMTPAYCSPEQSRREKLTDRTDVWSWALSILEIFTGGVTWVHGTAASETLKEYLAAGVTDPAIPLMPLGLVETLTRCFHEIPSQRPSMAEIVQALDGIDGGKLYHPQLLRISIAITPEEKAAVVSAVTAGKRFAQVGNSTLIDTETNLMWNGKISYEMPLGSAERFVREFSAGGYRDWVVPSTRQLRELSPRDLVFPPCIERTLPRGQIWAFRSDVADNASCYEVFNTETFKTYSPDEIRPYAGYAGVLPLRSAPKNVLAAPQNVDRAKGRNWFARLFNRAHNEQGNF